MVPDDKLTIRERAVAALADARGRARTCAISWSTLGYDVDKPWRELPKKDRNWILFTDEQPTVPVYAGYSAAEVRRALKRKEEPSYQGTFTGARKYVLADFRHHAKRDDEAPCRAVSCSARDCPVCHGKRLKPEALSVTFAGMDIAEISRLPLKQTGRDSSSRISGRRSSKLIRRSSGESARRAADRRGSVRRGSTCCSISASAI